MRRMGHPCPCVIHKVNVSLISSPCSTRDSIYFFIFCMCIWAWRPHVFHVCETHLHALCFIDRGRVSHWTESLLCLLVWLTTLPQGSDLCLSCAGSPSAALPLQLLCGYSGSELQAACSRGKCCTYWAVSSAFSLHVTWSAQTPSKQDQVHNHGGSHSKPLGLRCCVLKPVLEIHPFFLS